MCLIPFLKICCYVSIICSFNLKYKKYLKETGLVSKCFLKCEFVWLVVFIDWNRRVFPIFSKTCGVGFFPNHLKESFCLYKVGLLISWVNFIGSLWDPFPLAGLPWLASVWEDKSSPAVNWCVRMGCYTWHMGPSGSFPSRRRKGRGNKDRIWGWDLEERGNCELDVKWVSKYIKGNLF